MATGMVLVIVMRHIDLSVGSIVGFVSTIIGVAQVRVLPVYLGLDNPAIWIIAVILALAVGAAIGAFQGSLVAYIGIPAFIVTLGGQLFWRGAAWWVTTGQTIAPLDDRFALMGGGPHGSIGATASWALAAICCAGIVFGLYAGRQRRARFRFPQRPMWAEYVIAVVGCFVVLGATAIVNAYPWPERVAAKYAADNNIPVPEGGLFISTGYAIPVLIALVDRPRHDLPRPAHPVRPLCLRHRRQPGSRRARRHQHQEDHDSRLCADGRAGGDRRLHRFGAARTRRPTCSDSSTSFT